MTDINKQIEDLLKDKVKNCKNSTTIFDTKDYVLFGDAIDAATMVLSQYVSNTTFADAFRSILGHYRWRKVSEELPKVASKPYCIVVRSDDGRVQLEWILEGYDERVISFLLDKYIEWKPID